MANFDLAINKTLKFEGGYVDNINDPGGATNYGITIGTLLGLGSLGDLDHDGDIDKQDIKIMTLNEAKNIYHKLYWNGDLIISQAVAEKYFDMSVNMGEITAAKFLQQACVRCGMSMLIDGKIGKISLKIINSIVPNVLMTALCNIQAEHYWNIIEKDVEKNHILYKWPYNIYTDLSLAIKSKNIDVSIQCLTYVKKANLRPGKLLFLKGWLNRASYRFEI